MMCPVCQRDLPERVAKSAYHRYHCEPAFRLRMRATTDAAKWRARKANAAALVIFARLARASRGET